jgi:Mrp family chromosome partitioning ATPase
MLKFFSWQVLLVFVLLLAIIVLLLRKVMIRANAKAEPENLPVVPVIGFLNDVLSAHVDLQALFSQQVSNPDLVLFIERIRQLRAYVLSEIKAKSVVLVLSPEKAEGKTFLLAALSYSLYLVDRKVLIIDLNLKNNAITSMFNAKPMLQAGFKSNFSLQDLVSASTVPSVDLLGTAITPFSPLEMLKGPTLKVLLEQAKASYDYVFIECAHLNHFADGKELAPFADKIMALVDGERKLTQQDCLTFEFLNQFETRFAGVVLNKVGLRFDARKTLYQTNI